MNVNDLRNIHGVDVDQVLPLLESTEGMEELELSSTSKFRLDTTIPGDPRVFLGVPGVIDYLVDYQGYMKAMRLAGFPESVISKYPMELMIDPLNWGFENRLGEKVKAFAKHNRLVAFVKPTLDLVSVSQLVHKVQEVCGRDALFERLDHNLQYTNCSVILPNQDRSWEDARLRENDVIVGGVNFHTSIMGESPMEVSGYVYRLICGNGMVSAETKFKWSRKTETVPMIQWFEERLRACVEGLGHEMDKVEGLRSVMISEGHRAEVLANVFAEYQLSDRMRQAVLGRLTDNPPRHMWDVVNAITSVANDDEYSDNPHTIRRLQVIGGDMSDRVHVCPTCYAVSRN